MKLSRPPARQPPETIVALIDVVFFLLVFFMLIGRMDATAPFDVSPPTAATGCERSSHRHGIPRACSVVSAAERDPV